ncbi:MAG: type III pantothenate kinase [Candidatus Eremiobacteraeota bacterium]|nr:type III pantothenate kinase [Candidatus Eremiobacteraeota bacterium]
MLLAIDVGNTDTKLGCFKPGTDELLHYWRVATDLRRTADEYGVFLTQLFATENVALPEIDAVVIASVVPKLESALESVCRRYFGVAPSFLRADGQTLIPVRTEHPAESGADLIAAAIGARARFGAPLVVISFGTATAFIAVSTHGEYLGVSIAPGIAISIDALVGRTAKLPQVALDTPQHAIGRNTIEALQSGIVFGFVGQTEAIVRRMRDEMKAEAKVVATGGLAEIVAKQTPIVDAVDPYLSLLGLKLFHESL